MQRKRGILYYSSPWVLASRAWVEPEARAGVVGQVYIHIYVDACTCVSLYLYSSDIIVEGILMSWWCRRLPRPWYVISHIAGSTLRWHRPCSRHVSLVPGLDVIVPLTASVSWQPYGRFIASYDWYCKILRLCCLRGEFSPTLLSYSLVMVVLLVLRYYALSLAQFTSNQPLIDRLLMFSCVSSTMHNSIKKGCFAFRHT